MVARLIEVGRTEAVRPRTGDSLPGCRILINIFSLDICDTTHTGCGIRGVCGYFPAISSSMLHRGAFICQTLSFSGHLYY